MEEERLQAPFALHSALRRRAAMLGSRDPDDAAQEAYFRAARHPEVGPALAAYLEGREAMWTPPRLISWLFTTVSYVVREQRRRNGRTSSEPLPDAPDAASLPESGIRVRQLAALESCLGNLAENPRRALLLQAEGWKYDQIARELGANPDTVASWIRRARMQLETCMTKRLEQYE